MLKKFNWGHGIVLALGAFILFILFMIFIFPNGKQNSELVSDDYYTDELNYQKVIDAKKNADQLPAKPAYSQLPQGILLTFPNTLVPDGRQVSFTLFRIDDKNLDVNKSETVDGNNSVLIPARVLRSGPYMLKLRWRQNKVPYQVDYELLWKQP